MLECYDFAISIDINTLTASITAKEKIFALLFISAWPSGPPSATSSLRVSVQPAKPASPIRHFSEK